MLELHVSENPSLRIDVSSGRTALRYVIEPLTEVRELRNSEPYVNEIFLCQRREGNLQIKEEYESSLPCKIRQALGLRRIRSCEIP